MNDFVQAFFGTRPRYLKFGSPFFVASTTVAETQVPAIPFPGVPGGIQYQVQFEVPRIDLHPDTFGFVLPPLADQFALETRVKLTVGCIKRIERGQDKLPRAEPITTELGLCARGTLDRGVNDFGFVLEDVEIKDITPDSLESVIECILRMMLQAALVNLRIPYRAVSIRIGNIVPASGPSIKDDQVQLTANFV